MCGSDVYAIEYCESQPDPPSQGSVGSEDDDNIAGFLSSAQAVCEERTADEAQHEAKLDARPESTKNDTVEQAQQQVVSGSSSGSLMAVVAAAVAGVVDAEAGSDDVQFMASIPPLADQLRVAHSGDAAEQDDQGGDAGAAAPKRFQMGKRASTYDPATRAVYMRL